MIKNNRLLNNKGLKLKKIVQKSPDWECMRNPYVPTLKWSKTNWDFFYAENIMFASTLAYHKIFNYKSMKIRFFGFQFQ